MTDIDGIIFDTAYEIASKITGIKPAGMGECPAFDAIFENIQKSIREAI